MFRYLPALSAGGLDRSTLDTSILFETGNRVKLTWARTAPDLTADSAPSVDVGVNFNTAKIEYKTDFTDRLAFALLLNDAPLGADISYAGQGLPLDAFVESFAAVALLKYQVSDNFSVFGGLKYQSASAVADLTGIGGAPLNFSTDGGVGYVAGVAYERKDIALRVDLTYESRIDFKLDTAAQAAPNTILGETTAAAPEALTLRFRTGVAPKTLVFGSIRHAFWEDANVTLPASLGGTAITSFSNTTAYSLGVGRVINDQWSVSAALNYESSNGRVQSPLAPTDGTRGVSFGVKYTADAYDISFGVSHSKRGSATTALGQQFSNNTVTTAGVSVGFSF
ncbi:hypothetical protein [Amylibacter sp. IMCC11727]|uniref:OmpP1/FadL family transporter n=1 Tax=Amylibacter sp. IMCC11727 TaxID=3039851 RepID=UPI00244DBEB6|nr:hypothetical protein [Amylibacter sp. IMCC11727]WGI20398.1 hypothetical protein QBD29_09720 [Amylibacter sp. IMCC11727]